MARIPFSIIKYVRFLWMSEKVITYLHIDAQGNLVDWGGYPNYYGLLNLVKGKSATEQISFLEGLLPVNHTEVMQFLRVGMGNSAHVHLVPYQGSTWILMFDATAEHDRQQKVQQQANELSLLNYRQSRLIQQMEDTWQALTKEKQHLEQISQAQNRFFATLSHELRAPLSSILNSTELIDKNIENYATNYLTTIRNNADYLLSLVDNILEQTKLEIGQVVLRPNRCEIKPTLKELDDLFQPLAQEKGLSFTIESQPTIPTFIMIDGLRFRQVLINLINNAIKFTDQGFIKVTLEWQDDCLKFAVADSGPGIPPESQAKIFTAFHREKLAHNLPGVGLGLTISFNLIQLMGGELQVESASNIGSKFYGFVQAPATGYITPVLETTQSIITTLPAKILIIDDDIISCSLMETFLREQGHLVVSTYDSRDAVQLVQQIQPHLILMDLLMPHLDGYTLIRQLRHQQFTQPIIAISASNFEHDREYALKSGCRDYLVKPVNAEQLLTTIGRILNQTRS
jgi:signal transduction histidine kinase/ActR/RegA family two-component response regulator